MVVFRKRCINSYVVFAVWGVCLKSSEKGETEYHRRGGCFNNQDFKVTVRCPGFFPVCGQGLNALIYSLLSGEWHVQLAAREGRDLTRVGPNASMCLSPGPKGNARAAPKSLAYALDLERTPSSPRTAVGPTNYRCRSQGRLNSSRTYTYICNKYCVNYRMRMR